MSTSYYPISKEDAFPIIRGCLASGSTLELQEFVRGNSHIFIKDPETFAYLSSELQSSGLIKSWPCNFFGKTPQIYFRDFTVSAAKGLINPYLMDCKLFPTVGSLKKDEWYITTRFTFEFFGRPKYFRVNWDAFLWGHAKKIFEENPNRFKPQSSKQLIDVVDAFIYDEALNTNPLLLKNFRISYMPIQKQLMDWLLHENVSNPFYKTANQVSTLGYPGSISFILAMLEFCVDFYNPQLLLEAYVSCVMGITEDLYFHKSNTYTENLSRYQVK
jgi:hypothetical protein